MLAAGGSVPDFAARRGLDPPDGLISTRDRNPSPSPTLIEAARRANHALDGSSAGALRQAILNAREAPGILDGLRVEAFGSEIRARLFERSAPIDAWLGGKAGRDGFFADLEAMARPRELDEVEAARTALAALREAIDPAGLPAEALDFMANLDLNRPPEGRPA